MSAGNVRERLRAAAKDGSDSCSMRMRRVGVTVRPGGLLARTGGAGDGKRVGRPGATAATAPERTPTCWPTGRAPDSSEAAELFEIHGRCRAETRRRRVLLPVTPVRAAEDVHAVSRTSSSARLPSWRPSWGSSEGDDGFAMALSEACQNIVEHAGTGGWVGGAGVPLAPQACKAGGRDRGGGPRV